MDKLRAEFIRGIMISLKIESNPFIVSTIDEFTSNVSPQEYKSFMTALFGNQHQYLNGIDRVAKVAEQFKPQDEVDQVEVKAKELIKLVHGMDNTLDRDSEKMCVPYDLLLADVTFKTVNEEDIAILNNVAPHYSLKLLISKINTYQTSKDELNAFKSAVNKTNSGALAIEKRQYAVEVVEEVKKSKTCENCKSSIFINSTFYECEILTYADSEGCESCFRVEKDFSCNKWRIKNNAK